MFIRIIWIVIPLMIGLVLCQCGTEQHISMTEHVVGVWQLESWRLIDTEGVASYPYGESPEGQIIYTSTGEMSVQLMYPGADLEDVSSLDPSLVISRVSEIFFAYYGTYTIDEALSTVTHHVRGCLAQSWVGTDRVRNIELLDDDRMSLSATLGDDTNVAGENVLIWKLVR